MIAIGANAPLTTGASSPALAAMRGLTVGSWAAGTTPGMSALANQASLVVQTLARRFGTDPGAVTAALQHVSSATGLPLLTVARQALVRPVVSHQQWREAIRRFGWQASYILRHPGQDLTDLTVSMSSGFAGRARNPIVTAVM